jgi:hypothetical protein
MELTAEQRGSGTPSDQLEGLGSVHERVVTAEPSPQGYSYTKEGDGTDNVQELATIENTGISPSQSSDIQGIVERFMAVVQEGNESIRADINARISQLEESNTRFQEGLRAELRAENERLIKKFEVENQKLNKELSAKLESESKRLTELVGQVQQNTEAEFTAVKSQIEVVSTNFDAKLAQASSLSQDNTDRLSSLVIANRSEVEADINQLNQEVNNKLTRQGESLHEISQVLEQVKANTESRFDQVNAKFVALQAKIVGVSSRAAIAGETLSISSSPYSPPVVNQDVTASDNINVSDNHGSTNENPEDSGQSTGNNVCMRSNVHESSVNANIRNPGEVCFLSNTELPLPLFDDASETNPVCHLRRLDEFMRLKCIPKPYQLAIAYRSVVGELSRQWAETIRENLHDYEAFKCAFLKTWWSESRQNLVRRTLYQGRYDRNSNLSLSGYFLKHANMASYLNPSPPVSEIIESVKSHFPLNIQRAMLSNQLRTIEETLDFLRKVEIIETDNGFQRHHLLSQNQTQTHPRQGSNPSANDRRGTTQNQVRQIQYYPHNRNRSHWNNRRNEYRRDRERESESAGSNQLNPNATSFQGRQHPGQTSNPGTSRSEN